RFLQRTLPSQRAAFEAAPASRRDEAYFREKIGSIKTAEALVSDRRLLGVALGAFGLDGDINNRFFIRKVLEGGALTPGSLPNRLADKQYLALSSAFGFGDFPTPNTQLSDFADKILSNYKSRQFEIAVGDQNGDLRLALNAERELGALSTRKISENAKWFTVIGNTPLRQVFEKALGLPSSFAAIDIDKQLTILRARTEQTFGSADISQFSEPEQLERLVQKFLLRSETSAGGLFSTRGAGALQLLQSKAQSSATGFLSLRR
ncbi:MAG: DUF1217 domain-containing protein, partial [Paracoccaceae bacterium]|nr:DUF1217 domain-containing protein [Paracoccaceae bacterium]